MINKKGSFWEKTQRRMVMPLAPGSLKNYPKNGIMTEAEKQEIACQTAEAISNGKLKVYGHGERIPIK